MILVVCYSGHPHTVPVLLSFVGFVLTVSVALALGLLSSASGLYGTRDGQCSGVVMIEEQRVEGWKPGRQWQFEKRDERTNNVIEQGVLPACSQCAIAACLSHCALCSTSVAKRNSSARKKRGGKREEPGREERESLIVATLLPPIANVVSR